MKTVAPYKRKYVEEIVNEVLEKEAEDTRIQISENLRLGNLGAKLLSAKDADMSFPDAVSILNSNFYLEGILEGCKISGGFFFFS
jgi:hypothetical protein